MGDGSFEKTEAKLTLHRPEKPNGTALVICPGGGYGMLVKDGEGLTKFVTVKVTGAESKKSARTIAKSIANSPLVKTAIAGEDPNWGRIVAAVGKAGEAADRDRLAIWLGDILVAKDGAVAPAYREQQGAAYMKRSELVIGVDLGIGDGRATIWTCDLTKRYVEINADYRS